MNNRDYKQFGTGEYYHVYNRGNGKSDIFLDDQDYGFFMMRLAQNLFPDDNIKLRLSPLPANSFSLISYCLMPNHFHLLVRQNSEIPTSKLLLKVCTSYSIYFNKKYKHVGHVFQDRFKQSVVDSNRYLLWLSAYIHQNPKVARLVDNPINYPWSSYREYLGRTNNRLCKKEIISEQFAKGVLAKGNYQDFVNSSYEIIRNKKELEHMLLDG